MGCYGEKKHRGEHTHLIIFIDDFQQLLEEISRNIEAIYTQIAHHLKISVILTLQNPTDNSKRGNKAINSMKSNVTHVVVMPSLSCGNTFQVLDARHNPFQSLGQNDKKKWHKDGQSYEGSEKIHFSSLSFVQL